MAGVHLLDDLAQTRGRRGRCVPCRGETGPFHQHDRSPVVGDDNGKIDLRIGDYGIPNLFREVLVQMMGRGKTVEVGVQGSPVPLLLPELFDYVLVVEEKPHGGEDAAEKEENAKGRRRPP